MFQRCVYVFSICLIQSVYSQSLDENEYHRVILVWYENIEVESKTSRKHFEAKKVFRIHLTYTNNSAIMRCSLKGPWSRSDNISFSGSFYDLVDPSQG